MRPLVWNWRDSTVRSIIVSPDAELAQSLENALSEFSEVSVSRTLNEYPAPTDLVRTLRAQGPEVVFLSFESVERAIELVRFLETEAEGVQVVAIHRTLDATVLRETMRAGIREFLAQPFERSAVVDSLRNVKELIEKKPPSFATTDQIFSFLPSKAGVGTTTLAINVSTAIARRPNAKVHLADFDLSSGMLRFLLKLQNEYSVLDAVDHSLHMDENLFPQLVTAMGNLDVMHAGRISPNLRVDPGQIRNLVGFLRRNYSVVCFDLSGNLERYSIELMQESRRVMLVCTPEIPSLHLAREKLAFLKSLDLDSRIWVVLNRCQKKPLFTKEQVEEILGVPVVRTFANDYHGIAKATTAGKPVEAASELGKQFSEFADELLERRAKDRPEGKRKFLEFLSMPTGALVQGQK
jgi:pilus assembly protein CpaE